MAVNVLLADHDLDVHKLVADLLPIVFKNVSVDRVLKSEAVLEKLADPHVVFNLVIIDLQLGDVGGQNILAAIRDRFPHILDRMVLIMDSPDAFPQGEDFENIPHVVKPFSLDEFGEIVKKACVE
jgi:DNA-binding NtrC family response regulator